MSAHESFAAFIRRLDHQRHQIMRDPVGDWLDERNLERDPPPPRAEYDDTNETRKRSDEPS
jgi:hypothetical protein